MTTAPLPAAATAPKDWVRILAAYRDPDPVRSAFELAVSVIPFLGLWAVAWWALSISGWLALAIAVLNAGFLVRLFMIQHDCGHGGYFRSRALADWAGRAIGVLTLTPYDVWRSTHAIHHSSHGNLDRRGIGDIHTMTVEEYRALSPLGKLGYRLYRNPLVLFGLGPIYLFIFQNRLPVGLMRSGAKYWVSAMGTNAAIAAILAGFLYFGGVKAVALIFLPTVLVAASAGVWLFFVQHQFEDTHWDRGEDWQLHDAALHGSSHYDLPPVLRWLTGNIGIHHVHHLYSRIPFYRLPEVLRDHSVLATTARRLTLRESLACARLHLWDERGRRLLSFAEARKLPAAA
ncbi:fatty acid desaturase [Defluviimonas sp. WL0024]|uniref:Fatty acid desaturase n=2 Tax=Albidovulum TaxID=205889 RepID=A0ABT3J2A7_9RHOB|nr:MULTISPECIES: fatty acid desaturase [Defluviimonas]MCU9847749.1 fatty acid desaturase [Defluviimonas sp. WL0024]MCW3781822.1 fatty acid desaturase [Defluviimonas salinarum]